MPTSLFAPDFQAVLDAATTAQQTFPSPADWRDEWIYFLVVDRFNNPTARPLTPSTIPIASGTKGGSFPAFSSSFPTSRVWARARYGLAQC
jgi:hypothetical protein